MNRTDAILAGFTSVAVLTICFLTYQILKEPETKVAKVQSTRSVTTPLVLSDAQKRARSQQVREQAKKLDPTVASFTDLPEVSQPAKPMLISTTTNRPTLKQEASANEVGPTESIPTLNPIHFDFNKGELPEDAQAQLRNYAEVLKSGEWDVLIQGHTDGRGSTGFNLKVGKQRAEAVKNYLATLEVPKARMHAVSLGEFALVCTQDTEDCAKTNRRVAFSLVRRDPNIWQGAQSVENTEGQENNSAQTQVTTDTKEEEEEEESSS